MIKKCVPALIGNGQYLIFGGQIGGGQNSVNWSDLWFGRQFNYSTQLEDKTLDDFEIFNDLDLKSSFIVDVNLGLLWYAVMGENKSYYAGLALDHINEANVALTTDGNSPIYSRWTVHGGLELPLHDEMSVMPSLALVFQGPSTQINLGSNLRFTNRDGGDIAMRAGLATRISKTYDSMHMDALIVSGMLEKGRIMLGLSYDITMSDLSVINSRRGAFETTFIYTNPQGKRQSRVTCPNF